MLVVIKRVSAAQVTIKSDLKASIRRGLCVLVAFHKDDTWADVEYMMRKITFTKVFALNEGGMGRSVFEEGLEILCVSQPILLGVMREKGLEYPDAMAEEKSNHFFEVFVTALENLVGEKRVKNSFHGDYMEVNFDNEGAFTMMLDSRETVSRTSEPAL